MPIAFQDLRATLLHYKESDTTDRQAILGAIVNDINDLPADVHDKAGAPFVYTKMAYAATLINYADALRRIENQGFFDILIDFKMPAIFNDPRFQALNEFFEFHPTAPQMRLKKSIAEIPASIWHLFRDAQKAELESKGKAHKFNLDELDISNPPRDQLYPLPIQMMGQYENEAVDRISANNAGEYRFAKRFGVYLLPGGGMVDIDLENSQDQLMHKMLDEHLEEEHANLWQKAASEYNELGSDTFIATLRQCIANNTTIEPVLENHALRAQLNEALVTGKPNAEILADIIHLIDEIEISTDAAKKTGQEKLVHELRATLQLEPFKLTRLYEVTYEYIQDHTTHLQIEQFGDTRACGGKQLSNSFLMTGLPLENWFNLAFAEGQCEFGDDLTGSSIEHLTLLQAITQFSRVKFSHVLIALAHQLECFERDTLEFDSVWNNEHYIDARRALMIGASNAMRLEAEANQHRLLQIEEAYKLALANLTARLHHPKIKGEMCVHLHQLITQVKTLKASGEEDTSELTHALTQTEALLNGDITPEQYEATAKTMQGQASQGLRITGGIMLAIALIAVSIGLAGIAVPLVAASVATLLLTSSVCFFASRTQGLSAAMNTLTADMTEENNFSAPTV